MDPVDPRENPVFRGVCHPQGPTKGSEEGGNDTQRGARTVDDAWRFVCCFFFWGGEGKGGWLVGFPVCGLVLRMLMIYNL